MKPRYGTKANPYKLGQEVLVINTRRHTNLLGRKGEVVDWKHKQESGSPIEYLVAFDDVDKLKVWLKAGELMVAV
jgi:hypothetical protein